MQEYYQTHECDCGNTIKKWCAWVDDGLIEVDAQSFAQSDFHCDECGETHCYGDIESQTLKEFNS